MEERKIFPAEGQSAASYLIQVGVELNRNFTTPIMVAWGDHTFLIENPEDTVPAVVKSLLQSDEFVVEIIREIMVDARSESLLMQAICACVDKEFQSILKTLQTDMRDQ